MIVKIATNIAASFSIPVFVIGLVLLSIGTTLPEVIVSFRSLKSHSDGIFFGNLLGSVVINSTLIAGIVAIISPIEIIEPIRFLIPGAIFIIAAVLFWVFIKTKHFLSRREAVILLALYLGFVILEFV